MLTHPRRLAGLVAASLLCALTLAVAAVPVQASATATASTPRRPNVVLISTDDERLTDMRAMPHTRRLLGHGGTEVGEALSAHPLCCPARAQILTGQYAQNNGVRTNDGSHGGFGALREPDRTLGAWLSTSGYRTGFVGKFLNGYHVGSARPAGWSDFHPYVKNVYQPYDVGVADAAGNASGVKYYPTTHSNDVVRDYSLSMLDADAASGEPFFLWSSYVAPHGTCDESRDCSDPPVPPKRDRDAFPGARSDALAKPSYDEADVRDKPALVRAQPRTHDAHLKLLNRRRWQSLISVDDAVAATFARLRELGELDDTIVIFTSDNGYLLGEHRYTGKNVPYEEALRVPLYVRGPGVPAGAVLPHLMTSMVDLPATIAAVTGATSDRTRPLDGVDLWPYLTGARPVPAHQTQLVQVGPTPIYGTRQWTLRGVRTKAYLYDRWDKDGFVELYDLRRDPYELRNVAHDPRYRGVVRELARRTRTLETCSGATCRASFTR